MNQIEIFNSPEFGSIRTLEQNGKVLFCGTDVATALGYTNPRKAVRDHTRGGTKCSIGVQTGKKADGSPAVQMVEMLFIPEGDLYRLIAHSKLPSAERFEQWHNEQEKARQLMPYKLPAKLVEYLKTGPLRLEFPERELVKWAELYPYMDVQEMTWKRKKLLSLMAKMDNYSDYLLLWSPRDKKLWYLDIEHKEFHPLAKWEEFIADPGKYLNGMIEGEFEE